MAKKCPLPYNTGRNKKITGISLMIIGISGFIFSVYCFFIESYADEFGQYLSQLIGFFALGLAFLIAVAGGILFYKGTIEANRELQYYKDDDSRSEYDNIDKL